MITHTKLSWEGEQILAFQVTDEDERVCLCVYVYQKGTQNYIQHINLLVINTI